MIRFQFPEGYAHALGVAFSSLWPYLVVIGVLLLLPQARARYERRRLARAAMPEVERMTAAEFEWRLVVLFRALGYAVTPAAQAGNWGADLVISKGDKRTLVLAKRDSKNLRVKAVQEAPGARAKYECAGAMLVTIGYFTVPARVLARLNGVALWDRDQLIARLWETHAAAAQSPAPRPVPVPTPAPAAADWLMPALDGPPACPRCGAPMVVRSPRRGYHARQTFYGCSTYPRCHGMAPLPSA
jgi:restriction system protein